MCVLVGQLSHPHTPYIPDCSPFPGMEHNDCCAAEVHRCSHRPIIHIFTHTEARDQREPSRSLMPTTSPPSLAPLRWLLLRGMLQSTETGGGGKSSWVVPVIVALVVASVVGVVAWLAWTKKRRALSGRFKVQRRAAVDRSIR